MRKSKIIYNPTLSIAENAVRCNVTESAIRKYIYTHNIDRSQERKNNIITALRKEVRANPSISIAELVRKTTFSKNTIKKYYPFITGAYEGSNNNTNKVVKNDPREYRDFYCTPPEITDDILQVEHFGKEILEPACGTGIMAKVIEAKKYNVSAFDLIDRGYGKKRDFLTYNWTKDKYDIITNPPYDNANEFILKALEIYKNKIAMLLPLNYLSSKARYRIYQENPPCRIYIYTNRICMAKNAEFDKYKQNQNPEIYAWYVWEKGYQGDTVIKWIAPHPIKAVIFDFDLTLFDSTPSIEFRKRGYMDKARQSIQQFGVYDGIKELLSYLKDNNIKSCIVSNCVDYIITDTLKHFDIDVDYIIARQTEKEHRKPNAYPIELALQQMALKPENVIAIGDNKRDIEAYKKAHIKAFGCIWHDKSIKDKLLKAHADGILENPTDLIDYLK